MPPWIWIFAFALAIAASPFFPGEPIKSNYIPAITNAPFAIGLSLIVTSIVLMLLPLVVSAPLRPVLDGRRTQQLGVYLMGMILLLSLAGFCYSYIGLPEALLVEEFYEYLFWGGGHLLQFAYTQLLVVVWLWLASATGG